MKNMILSLLLTGAASLAFGQDRMPINNDLNNRTAAKDMNNSITPPALPVLNTYVSPDMISKANSSYGKNLYSVTAVKTALGENAYQVTTMDNGQAKYAWVNEGGSAVANVFRTPETDSMNALTNNNNMGTNSSMNVNNSNAVNTNNTMNNAGSTTVNSNVTANQNTMDSARTNTQMNTTANANAMDSSMNNTTKNEWSNNMNNTKATNNSTVGKAGMTKPNKQEAKKNNDKGTMSNPSNNNENKTAKPVKNSPAKPKEGK